MNQSEAEEIKAKFDAQPWLKAKVGYPKKEIERVLDDMDRNIEAINAIEYGLDHMPVHSSLKNLFYTALITIYLEVKLRSNPDKGEFFKATTFQAWKEILLNLKALMKIAKHIIKVRQDQLVRRSHEDLERFNKAIASAQEIQPEDLPDDEDLEEEGRKEAKPVVKPSENN